MSITIFSFFMAVLWFDAFVLLSAILRRKAGFLLQYSLLPLTVLVGASLLRVMLPFELPFSTVVRSYQVLPCLQHALRQEVVLLGVHSVSAAEILVGSCCIVSGVLLIRLCMKIKQGHSVVQKLKVEQDDRTERFMADLVNETKPGQAYTLIVTPDISIPMMSGYVKPTILLPTLVATLSDVSLQHIIRHEWSHFLSKDLWVKLLIHVICCVMWWNPVVYLLKEDLDQILELRCDHRLIQEMKESERLEYLSTILNVLNQLHLPKKHVLGVGNAVGFVGAIKGEKTRQRFQMVLDYENTPHRHSNLLFRLSMVALFLFSFSFVLQPFSLPEGVEGFISVTPDNAYISLDPSGTYTLIVNGQCFGTLSEDELNTPPHDTLPIRNQIS